MLGSKKEASHSISAKVGKNLLSLLAYALDNVLDSVFLLHQHLISSYLTSMEFPSFPCLLHQKNTSGSKQKGLYTKTAKAIHPVMVQSHRLLSITGSTNQRTPNPSLQMISKRRYWEPFNQHDPSQIDRPSLQPKKQMDKFRPQQWHKAPHSMHFPFLRLPIEEQPSISSEYAINVV